MAFSESTDMSEYLERIDAKAAIEVVCDEKVNSSGPNSNLPPSKSNSIAIHY
jgi:hypothetical protein